MSSTLIGASSPAQIIENAGALKHMDFSKEELRAIDMQAQDGGVNLWEKPSQGSEAPTLAVPVRPITPSPMQGKARTADLLKVASGNSPWHGRLSHNRLPPPGKTRLQRQAQQPATRRQEAATGWRYPDQHL